MCDVVDGCNDSAVVVLHDSMFDRVAILMDVDLDVGCCSVQSRRVADASEIDGADSTDLSVGDIVRVTGEHDIGAAFVNEQGEVVVGDADVGTLAVG